MFVPMFMLLLDNNIKCSCLSVSQWNTATWFLKPNIFFWIHKLIMKLHLSDNNGIKSCHMWIECPTTSTTFPCPATQLAAACVLRLLWWTLCAYVLWVYLFVAKVSMWNLSLLCVRVSDWDVPSIEVCSLL